MDKSDRRNLKPKPKESELLTWLLILIVSSMCIMLSWDLGYLNGPLTRLGLEDYIR